MINPHGEVLPDFFGERTIKKRGCGRNQGLILANLIRHRHHELMLEAEISKKDKMTADAVSGEDHRPSGVAEDRILLVSKARKEQIKEENEELKQLQAKLRQSYILKCITAQRAEKEAQRIKRIEQTKVVNNLISEARFTNMELERFSLEEEFQRKFQYGQDLRRQLLHEQQEKNAKRNQELLIEKQMVAEVAQRLNAGHLAVLREEQAKNERFKAAFDEYMQMQSNWKKKKEEKEPIRDLVLEKHAEALKVKAEKQKELERKQKISQEIGIKIKELHDQKMKKQSILEDLYIEEKKFEEEKNDRAKQEKEIREKAEMVSQLDRTRDEHIRRRQEERVEEVKFRNMQERILAEKEKLDLASKENKLNKIMENKRVIQECLAETKRRRAQEIAMVLKRREMDLQEEQRKADLAEEVRMEIIKEHSGNLLGYFPTGILTESERKMFIATDKKNVV